MSIQMTALKSFEGKEGNIKKGDSFKVESENRARDLERNGLAARGKGKAGKDESAKSGKAGAAAASSSSSPAALAPEKSTGLTSASLKPKGKPKGAAKKTAAKRKTG